METRTYRTFWHAGNNLRRNVYHAYMNDDTALSFKRYLTTKKGQDALKQACERYNCTPLYIIGDFLHVRSRMDLEHDNRIFFTRVVERPQ